jgi:uncharacterized protein (UPF0276 family)
VICSTLSCNLDQQVLTASLPIFERGKADAIEWSFDTLYKVRKIPDWFSDLLQFYGKSQRLIGHGVYYSLFSGKWLQGQEEWLAHLRNVCDQFHFDHITEHFGFMTGADFHHGAPMSIPFTQTTLRIGQDRLKRMYDACRCPVGLENLAFSYSSEDVLRHGEFLEKLVEPVNGFLILDLHNVYCQAINFEIPMEHVLAAFPVHRVREIHISGGSWELSDHIPQKKVRRDTHDAAVPDEVFDILPLALHMCEHVKYVVMERLGVELDTPQSRDVFQSDYYRMDDIVKKQTVHNLRVPNKFLPDRIDLPSVPPEDLTMYQQQMELTDMLESARDLSELESRKQHSSLAHSDWHIERWDPYMTETAMKIAQKWKHGFDRV